MVGKELSELTPTLHGLVEELVQPVFHTNAQKSMTNYTLVEYSFDVVLF